jgi:hypothetical protein
MCVQFWRGTRFQWSRLLVDLTPTPRAVIADMAPREVTDDRPVEMQTTVGLGVKFNIVANVLGADLSPEYSRTRHRLLPADRVVRARIQSPVLGPSRARRPLPAC